MYRDLPLFVLDRYISFPTWLEKPVVRWATPRYNNLERVTVYYNNLPAFIKRTKRVSPIELFKRVFVYREMQGYIYPFSEKAFFWGIAKIALTLFTFYEMGRDSFQAYKKTKSQDHSRKVFVHQLLKWFWGAIIATLCFDLGYTLHPQKGMIAGTFSAILGSSVGDYFWNKLDPRISYRRRHHLGHSPDLPRRQQQRGDLQSPFRNPVPLVYSKKPYQQLSEFQRYWLVWPYQNEQMQYSWHYSPKRYLFQSNHY